MDSFDVYIICFQQLLSILVHAIVSNDLMTLLRSSP